MKKNTKKQGFLLIEAMMATAVLVFGIVAVIPLVSFSLREAMDSRDQVIAGMLAQEGVELVQNLRDNNLVQGKTAFQDNFPTTSKDNCQIGYNDSDVKTCNNGNGSKVLNLNGSYYEHTNSGVATKFQRKIQLKYDTGHNNDAKNLEIISVVVWGKDGFPASSNIDATNCNTATRCVYTKTTLTTWAPPVT